jgi:hypothetical protein
MGMDGKVGRGYVVGKKHTSWLCFIDGSIWICLGAALPEAIATLLVGRVFSQDIMLAPTTMIRPMTECARNGPRTGAG